ncbi:MAG TPA: glucose-6-phosphate dehydrogenase assembly protein OpcA, partial [Candidatus Saccharimonadales bacterium]|nr:glucose-6-phosphate dehydrogenase assembly protein OpcA [Candidatus Saccharimonadales bacterium]
MTLDSYTSGKAMHVDVAAIEREITRLWKDAAEPGSEETAPVMRACLLNLLVVTGPEGSSPDLARTLATVVQARPCRILLLQIDAALPSGSLDAWISAHCIVPRNGERQVCCEQITVRSSADAAVHLPSLASALAASDLPILLWVPRWPPPDPEALLRLAGITGRVIVDSIGMTPAELAATGSRHASMGDLNWDRLLPFQWAVARAFDSHLLRPLASEIRGVATTGGDGSETASVLFTGWLRSVLG